MLLNLPSEIIMDIFSRLPVRSVVYGKCVSKELLHTLSSPKFAECHLSKSTPGLMFGLKEVNKTICRVVEIEDTLGLQNHDQQYKPLMKFNPADFIYSPAHVIKMDCSVDGLVCLHDLDSAYICNPITREFIPLPRCNSYRPDVVVYGLGISKLGKEYKVVQISEVIYIDHSVAAGIYSSLTIECSVYTLGTGSWRAVEHNETYEYGIHPSPGVFLNGISHWLVADETQSSLISCFNFDAELFQPLSPPPSTDHFASLVVVRDYLWLGHSRLGVETTVWVMKEYGVKESWTKEFVIRNYLGHPGTWCKTILPVKGFKSGDILFVQGFSRKRLLYYCNKTGTVRELDLFTEDTYNSIQALSHTSSFLSLKRFPMEIVLPIEDDLLRV